jgi:Fe-S-cluster containining protein
MYNQNSQNITECMRCGTCCLKGGPVLHRKDKEILLAGHAGHQHLVTIRKGETAFNPVKNMFEPVRKELIKVKGKSADWTCCFYDEQGASCKIYKHRFLECKLLKCWDTADIISVIGKNTLDRTDIINPKDPIIKIIEQHEQECPFPEINDLLSGLSSGKEKSGIFSHLQEFVRRDMSVRSLALSELGLKEEYELFIFGRPLTEILKDHGLTIRFSDNNIHPDNKKRLKGR